VQHWQIKDFNSIKMHGTTVKKDLYVVLCTHAVQVNCTLFRKGERHLCCASDRGLEKKLFRNDLLRHFQSRGSELSEHGQSLVGGGTVYISYALTAQVMT